VVGVPVAIAFGVGSIILCLVYNIDPGFVMPIAFKSLDSYIFLALPLYILAGSLMGESGIGDALINLFTTLFGQIKGGLAAALVGTNAVFGAVSGAASSAVGALGPVVIPRMVKAGYPRGFASALTAASAVLSLLIPPTMGQIIYGVLAHLPITILFVTILGPGLLLTLVFIVISLVMCRNMPNLVTAPKVGFRRYSRDAGRSFIKTSWALFMPVIILGGIYSGIFTPTEAACVAVIYCIPVGFFVYHTLSVKSLAKTTLQAGVITASIMIVFFFLFIFSRIFIVKSLPAAILAILTGLSSNKYVLLLLLNLLMIVMGMVMDDTSALVIAAIIIHPVAMAIGINPFQFAAVVGVNLGMGLITPPVAPTLYMAARMGGGIPLEEYIKPAFIYVLFGYLPVLILTTYVPQLSLFIPTLLGMTVR